MKRTVTIFLFFVVLSLSNNFSAAPDKDSTLAIRQDTTRVLPENFTFASIPRLTIDGQMPNKVTSIRTVPMLVAGSVWAGSIYALHMNQKHAWWSGERESFHYDEDWGSTLQVDKFGHAFGSYIMSYAFAEVFLESGFNPDDADFYGAVFGGLYQTYVETEDGLARTWGFSPSDWYFDAIGATYYLAQHYVPYLQNFTLKWQYVPSEWVGKPIISRQRTFVDDYNSSTFFVSVNVHNMAGGKLKEYWPDWINLAIGYGGDAIDFVKDPTAPPDQLSRRRYIVGLDLCLDKMLPEGGNFWNWWRQTFRFIKLPAPSVEFTPGNTKFYLFYPFRINMGFMHL